MTSGEGASLHSVLETLSSQFVQELNLFAMFGIDRFVHPTDDERVGHGLAYLAARGATLAGILAVLDAAGVRPSRQPQQFPNFVDMATLPDDARVGDYLAPDSHLITAGAAASELVTRWMMILREDQPPAAEAFLLFRTAARVTSQQGYAAGVRYVLDLLDAGHVLQPHLAGDVIAALVVAAGRDLSLEDFTAALWDEDRHGDWAQAVADPTWIEPHAATAPMAPLVGSVIERCLTAKASVVTSTTHDEWLVNLHRFRRVSEAADAMVRRALKSPSLSTRTILSQLEENRADIAVINMLEDGHGFHRVVDEVERLTAEMSEVLEHGEASRRYRAERQLIPDPLRRRPTPNDWFTPTWRIACPLSAWRTGDEGPSPFTCGGPNEQFIGMPLSDAPRGMAKLAEIADALESGDNIAALALATRLVYDFPWCDLAYWRASEGYYNLGGFGYLDAAIDFLIPTLSLQPLQSKIWESLALSLQGIGDSLSADVVWTVARFVESEAQALAGVLADDEPTA